MQEILPGLRPAHGQPTKNKRPAPPPVSTHCHLVEAHAPQDSVLPPWLGLWPFIFCGLSMCRAKPWQNLLHFRHLACFAPFCIWASSHFAHVRTFPCLSFFHAHFASCHPYYIGSWSLALLLLHVAHVLWPLGTLHGAFTLLPTGCCRERRVILCLHDDLHIEHAKTFPSRPVRPGCTFAH